VQTGERDVARYALADAQARDDAAWRDVEALQVRLEALGDVEAACASALAAKEPWAAAHGPQLMRLLTELDQLGHALRRADAALGAFCGSGPGFRTRAAGSRRR
jgi:hypothetical protein